jgi:hypothetical protein
MFGDEPSDRALHLRLGEDQVRGGHVVVLLTLPASDPNAPLGSRIAIEGMCSKESGIDRSSTFTTVLQR